MLFQLIIIIIISCIFITKFKEHFYDIPIRSTRNMSYDIRGDPCVIKRVEFPFNNSDINDYNYSLPPC